MPFNPPSPSTTTHRYHFHRFLPSVMLVISPESSCDICLEHFALDGHHRAPHAPRCGHVFCLRYGNDPELYSTPARFS